MKANKIAFPILVLLLILWAPAALAAEKSPTKVVKDFYAWYLKTQRDVRSHFSQARSSFDPHFYDLLVEGFKKGPSDKGGWIDLVIGDRNFDFHYQNNNTPERLLSRNIW